jgi:predicted phosphodiesterase
MKIKLLSDLHLELGVNLTAQKYLKYDNEDVLILAGDIDSGIDNIIQTLERFYTAGYPKIVYVPGNHEYYGSTGIDETNAKLRRYSENNTWLHYLNKDWVAIGNTVFIGATLWSNFRNNPLSEAAASRGIADFRKIKSWSTVQCAVAHENDATYLKSALQTLPQLYPEHRIVVVTHFLPAQACIDPYWVKHGGALNDYFANGLDEYLLGYPHEITWCFGHTHSPVDTTLGSVRLLANPYGYHGYESQIDFKDQCYV